MISIQPKTFHLIIRDMPPVELTVEEAQELSAGLMTMLAPTLDLLHPASTEEPEPFISLDAATAIKTEP